jgi:hypothetical protein
MQYHVTSRDTPEGQTDKTHPGQIPDISFFAAIITELFDNHNFPQ